METNYETIKQQLEELNSEIKTRITDEKNDRHPIYDGAISLEDYLNSKIKILWLLKEAYDEKDGKGGNWSYSEECKNEEFVKKLVFGDPYRTWQPIVQISSAILNGFEKKNIDNEMIKILNKISILNIQKLPSKNGAQTNMDDVYEAFEKFSDIILRQIEVLQPHIIICGYTFDVINQKLDIENLVKSESCSYCKKGDTLIIKAYHPAQWASVDRELYIDHIILAAKNNL